MMRFALDQDRGRQLLQARSYFNEFLKIQDNYDILATRHVKLYRQFLDDKDNFSTISTTDFNARRAEKVANYRLGKELEQKLAVRPGKPRQNFPHTSIDVSRRLMDYPYYGA